MNIYIPNRKQAKESDRGAFVNVKGGSKVSKEEPVHMQYSAEELKKIHNAVHFTKAMFPNNATMDATDE